MVFVYTIITIFYIFHNYLNIIWNILKNYYTLLRKKDSVNNFFNVILEKIRWSIKIRRNYTITSLKDTSNLITIKFFYPWNKKKKITQFSSYKYN